MAKSNATSTQHSRYSESEIQILPASIMTKLRTGRGAFQLLLVHYSLSAVFEEEMS